MDKNSTSKPRPLSPHLSIYKLQLSSATSITHRITGAALFFAFVLLCWWFSLIIFCPEMAEKLKDYNLLSCVWGKAILTVWAFGLYYHLLNGIRHLCWDAGKGLSIKVADFTGIVVICLSLAFTAASWWIIN